MSILVINAIRFYQGAISYFGRPRCRFVPSCSTYMIDAITLKGLIRGLWVGLRRIARCHPWGGHGWDPVQ